LIWCTFFFIPLNQSFDAVILGAGAAGLMCAIEAARRGRSVALLERAASPGKKILISGGGRCNFTNLHCGPENFISASPDFAKSALARYTPADFIALVEKHHIPYHEKKLGQLFCDRSAQDILDMLLVECRAAGVKIFLDVNIREVQRDTKFIVRADSTEFLAVALVVATGGLSIPKIGATAFGYNLARQFGLKIEEPRAALVPFIFARKEQSQFHDLAGVSANVVVTANQQSFREAMLFTHRGVSGPAILQASSYWRPGEPIHIDLAPDQDVAKAIGVAKTRNLAAARAALHEFLPNRLAARWLELNAPENYTNQALARFDRNLHDWTTTPAGTEGLEKAEVTAGGVSTQELSSKTMECKNVPGLFFIGEVVDVTGHLGGFNFQWAWASGAAAGRAL